MENISSLHSSSNTETNKIPITQTLKPQKRHSASVEEDPIFSKVDIKVDQTSPLPSGKTKNLISQWEQKENTGTQNTLSVPRPDSLKRRTFDFSSIPVSLETNSTQSLSVSNSSASVSSISSIPSSSSSSNTDSVHSDGLQVSVPYNYEKKEIDLRKFLVPNLDPTSRQAIEKGSKQLIFLFLNDIFF